MKRTMAALLCLLLCLLAGTALAANHTQDLGGCSIEYELNESTGTARVVKANGDFTGKRVELPAQITVGGKAYAVTEIGASAFRFCETLQEVTLPEGLTTIGEMAFQACRALTKVTIPSSVTEFGTYAFEGCMALQEVTLSEGLTTIGESAFRGCRALTKVTIPSSVTEFGARAFATCYALQEVTLPEGLTTIGEMAFWACSSLTKVTIPSSVTEFGREAFAACGALQEVTLSEGLTTIGEAAFQGCRALTKVTIPSSVTEIRGWAFYGCITLQEVTVPSSVIEIGRSAFWYCEQAVIYYPKNANLGWGAFENTKTRILYRVRDDGKTVAVDEVEGDALKALPGMIDGKWVAEVPLEYRAEGRHVHYAGEGTVCLICNKVMHTHTWNVRFDWTDDGKGCTVTLTCAGNAAHTQTLTADVTAVVKTPATCTAQGVTAYTAKATFDGQTYTETKDVADIPASGHRFENGVCVVCGAPDPNVKVDLPQTGDESRLALWVGLLAVCAASTLVVKRRRQTR